MPKTLLLPNFIHTCLVISFLFSIITASYAGEVIFDNALKRLELNAELNYLYDEQQLLQLSQVMDDSNSLAWKTGSQIQEELLMPAGLYWIKGKITNPHAHPISVTLEIQPASIDAVDSYIIYPDKQIFTAYTNAGLNAAFENRPTLNRQLVNTLDIPAHSTITLVWRVKDTPKLLFNATAWTPEQFIDRNQHAQLIHGMLYGIILIMMLYNVFLSISTKEKSYFYYVLYIASAGYLLAAEEGHIYYYINTAEVWPKHIIYTVIYALHMILFGQFCNHFLRLKKHSIHLMQTVRALSIISALALLVAAISNSLSLVGISLLAVTAVYASALVAGMHVHRLGIISAGYFVIAIMILVFSTVANTMATFGLIKSDSFTQSISAVGTTIMLVFFSLALADRINQLQKISRQASSDINKANNEKLKALVELQISQTERIKLEQSASQARVESRSKSKFLANLSHEIRTPMNGVLGMTELMKTTPLTEQQKHYLTTVEHSGHTLLSIIEGLQDYAKIESGKMTCEFVSFNLETLLDDCISTFALKATEKNIQLIADLDSSIEPVLRGDATKLQQIILNLLSNAFKFTEAGNIVLRVHPTDRSAVNRIELRFDIQDSGIGLTDEEQHRLFSPFQHGDNSTYGRYGGSGLGLAISKQLAKIMDGQIGVNSTPDKGSCFWFTARFMIDNKPNTALQKKRSSNLVGQQLLLIESNGLIADILKRLLISWQINVHHAKDLEQARSQILSAKNTNMPFSIILSDYQLTDGNVLSLLTNDFLQSSELSPSSIIVMSMNEQTPQQNLLINTNTGLLLEKPITFKRLHSVLKKAVTAQKEPHTLARENIHQETSPIKVLLVEDNPVNQMVLTGLLSSLGIKPEIATDGLQAVEMSQADHFDLVLMDCEMPTMDGYEATRRIRDNEQQSQKPRTTIVALSAHAATQHQRQAKLAGMNNYLIKPVSVVDLRSVVENIRL